MTSWSVYLIRTAGGHLYTGITTDVARRIAQHGGRHGAKALRGRGPLVLVYKRVIGDRGLALRVEHRLKRCSRSEKEVIAARRPSRTRLLELLAVTL